MYDNNEQYDAIVTNGAHPASAGLRRPPPASAGLRRRTRGGSKRRLAALAALLAAALAVAACLAPVYTAGLSQFPAGSNGWHNAPAVLDARSALEAAISAALPGSAFAQSEAAQLSPTLAGSIANNDTMEGATGIATFRIGENTYAAVAAWQSNAVQIINVTDPDKPTLAGSIADTAGLLLGAATGITIFGNDTHTYAAVTANRDPGGIQILDVTDPYNVTAADSITSTNLRGAWGIDTFDIGDNTYAAVAASEERRVHIFNVTRPDSVGHVGVVFKNGLRDVLGIATFENSTHTYVAATAKDAVRIIDVNDPASPVVTGRILDTGDIALNDPYDIATFKIGENTYAAVAASVDNGVQMLNITDPTEVTAAGSVTNGSNVKLFGPRGIATFEAGGRTYAAVSAYFGNSVQILDVTDPAEVTAAGSIVNGTTLYGAYGIDTFRIDGTTYAAVAADSYDGVQILRLAAPDTVPPADDGSPFVTTWETTELDKTITIPGTGMYTVSWGDESSDDVTNSTSHAYETPGTYTVSITGGLEEIRLGDAPANAQRLQSIEQWGDIKWATMKSAFLGASNMEYHATDAPDLSEVTDVSSMFQDATAFNGNVSSWNVSQVTDMGYMFQQATSFNGNVSSWNVSQVTYMGSMFFGASAFDGDISSWNVSQVTGMNSMFEATAAFNQPLSSWNVSKVTDMSNMFSSASSFNKSLSSWDVSQVTNMYNMFRSASDFNQPLSSWNVSKVTDMSNMFRSASSFNKSLSSWDVSQVDDMYKMFDSAHSFQQNLGNWYVVPADTAYAASDVSLNVTTISAQNAHLDDHSPEYGIGSGGDSDLFAMDGNTLMFKAAPSEESYTANVTASGTGVFKDGNYWRMLEITVIDNPPTITLIGANPDSVPVGSTYADLGYACADDIDAGNDLLLHLDDSELDVNYPGTYTVIYTCTDSSGNQGTATRTVIVAGPVVIDITPTGNIDNDNSLGLSGASGIATFKIGDDTYAAVTSNQDDGVQILNVTDPGNVTAKGSIGDDNNRRLNGADGIAIFGNDTHTYAAVAAYEENGVQILDITDPDNVIAKDSIGDNPNRRLVGASGIATFKIGTGTYAAVTAYEENGVQILNVTDPTDITATDSIVDSSSLELGSASGIATFKIGTGTYAAVAAFFDDGVQILNVTDPTDITATDSIDDSDGSLELNGASGIATFKIGTGTYAAVAASTDLGVQILDVTDPTDITATDSIDDSDGSLELDGALRIAIFGNSTHTYAAVAAFFDDGVQILNVTDPTEIEAVDSIDNTGSLELDGASGIATFKIGTGTYAAVAASIDHGVQVLRLADADPDTTPPTIALNGPDPDSVPVGSAYVEPGATCTDDTDGSLQVTISGTVDTSNPGTHTLIYTCTDLSGNESTISRTVTVVAAETPIDTTDPVITLNGPPALTITAGTTYTDQGATCTDETDGSLTPITSSTVDASAPGTYAVTYTCTDSSGNGSTITRTVTVVDTTDPVITLNGPSTLTITAGTTYTDQGATCTDETDGSLTPITSSTVDASAPGTYAVTYTCTDSSGNGSTITRTVTVVDTTDPVITLNGPSTLTITAGTTYTDQGATCTDETDGSLTPITSSTVDASAPGTYAVTYTCTDSSGNGSTITRTVTVVDTTDPVITLNGPPALTITAGTTYTEQGATCTDDTDGSLQVTTAGTVDASAPDIYTVTYTCTDSSGNESTATREVTVVAAGPPADNNPPDVDAGADQTVGEGDTVTLSGSATDPDAGDAIESYSWSAPPGSGITFADGSSASTTFTAPAVDADATFTLTLTASDGANSGSDDVDVTVKDTGSAFITTWKTTSPGEEITIPGTGTYDVAWGDGQFSGGASDDAPHTYATPGTYTVSITGDLERINLGDNSASAQKLQSIEQWGGIEWATMESAFRVATDMEYRATDAPDLSGVADMANMFYRANSFDGDLSSWDVSQVTGMNSMFWGATSFNGNVSSWDVSQVTDMTSMFLAARSFNGDLSSWDVSQVTDMTSMFLAARSFNGDLSSWNVSSAIKMGSMFSQADSFGQNLGNWYVVPEDTAYATSENTLNVTTVSAQNSVLDGHSPEYGIGSGGDSDLFAMTGNALMFKDAPSVGRHPVNVTASGSGVFEGGNSWRMLEIAVAGTGTDTTLPTITLDGANPLTIPAGSTYADPGYSCADETDAVGDLRLELNDSGLDVNTPGTYTVIYTCTDLSGNIAIAIRGVEVVAAGPPEDNNPPTITLSGASSLTIQVGTTYADPGYTCTDETDTAPTVTTSGTVDTSSPGTYTLTYTCTDSSDNSSTATREVTVVAAGPPEDNNPPTITIIGDDPLTIQAGTTYVEPGYSCTDETDTAPTVTTSGTIDTSSPGTYTVTYTCTDSSDNSSTATREVTVVDTTDPVITLNGSSTLTITAGTTYTEQGATCTDDTDPAPTVTTSGTVDTSSPGTYTVTYTCTDSSDNSSTATREVTVVAAETPIDTTDPVITINGSSELTITAGTTYTEQGATCTDDTDPAPTVTTSGTVDTSSPGTYTVTYTCTDSSDNSSTATREVTVVDTTDPVITLNGSSTLTITAGTTYTEQGATCTDDTDPAPTVTTSGTVDTSSPGTYTVTYTCTDSSDNSSTATREVTVVDTTDPVITLNGSSTLTITAGTTYTEQGATCTDDTDPAPTVTTSGTVDTSNPDTYTVTYTCTDSSDNSSTATREVTVVDTTDPVITINGSSELTITAGTTYTEQGATCTDDTDPAPTVTTSGTVDTSNPDTYTVTYTCTDSSGNNATADRIVFVRAADTADDTKAPEIDITGESTVRLHVDDNYVEMGARCVDDTDGTWNAGIHKSTVNTSEVGSYIVIYECTDSSGNTSLAIRHVEVVAPEKNLPPIITLNGDSEVTVRVGFAYVDPGATCTDPEDGSLEVTVRGGNPDTSSAGKRHIHYTCMDSDGETDSVVRTVTVQ